MECELLVSHAHATSRCFVPSQLGGSDDFKVTDPLSTVSGISIKSELEFLPPWAPAVQLPPHCNGRIAVPPSTAPRCSRQICTS
jgi:hypothetical protein